MVACFCPRGKWMLKRTLCLLLFAGSLGPVTVMDGQGAAPTAASLNDVVIERGVPMKTRDGVTLPADIYRPAGDGPFPVLLQRTPYDKNNAGEFGRRGG